MSAGARAPATAPARRRLVVTPPAGLLVQRCGGTPCPADGCGGHDGRRVPPHRTKAPAGPAPAEGVPPIVHDVLASPGHPVEDDTRAFMEDRFGHDFSHVRVHTDARAAESVQAVSALAYTVGPHIVFGAGRYAPGTGEGRRILGHELAHVVQQSGLNAPPARAQLRIAGPEEPAEREAAAAAHASTGAPMQPLHAVTPVVQRQAEPYITQVSVNLTAPQSVKLSWKGTPPSEPGTDSFTCSTGKGYSNPEDPPGTCNRGCCSGADVQCAPPHDEPGRRGACCTPIGNAFWTGTPRPEHNGWKFWTPVEPIHTAGKRGIALHQHNEVTGQAIGHGCIRMDEKNAERIFRYSRGKATNVTITGRAKVDCPTERRCDASGQREPSGAAPTEAVALTRPDEENPGGGGGAAALPELAELTVAAPGIVQRFGEPLVQRQQPQGTPPPEPVAQPPEAPKPPAAAAEGSKKACLTFDDGPQLGTADVLDVLRGRASATFFLNGQNIESLETMKFNVGEDQQRVLVRRMLDEGHRLGNHTLHHTPTKGSEYDRVYKNLSDADRRARLQRDYQTNIEHFERVVGGPVPGLREFARLPGQGTFIEYGGDLRLVKLTQGLRMAYVAWQFEFAADGEMKHLPVHDWQGIARVDATAAGFPKAADVVLLHDRNWRGKATLLAQVLTKLERNGFTFGRLSKEGTCS
jgi:peptidoglycan/xylan/chitin deacetylase (PgdA/CDA1 family)